MTDDIETRMANLRREALEIISKADEENRHFTDEETRRLDEIKIQMESLDRRKRGKS